MWCRAVSGREGMPMNLRRNRAILALVLVAILFTVLLSAALTCWLSRF